MTASDSEKWAEFQELGRTRFVCRYGMLGWGVPTGFLFALIQGVLHGQDAFLSQIIPALILFPFAGIFWGHIMWRLLGKKHAKAAATGLNK